MELARQARAEDRQACTRLLSQALVAAESMRGGAALVGDATTVTLLERWTQPGDAAHLLVGEYEGAVVGLLAVTAPPGPRGPHERPDRVLLRGDGCPGGRRGHGAHGSGGRLVRRDGAATGSTRWRLPGDRTTKQRLEAAGFTARLLTLSRRLD